MDPADRDGLPTLDTSAAHRVRNGHQTVSLGSIQVVKFFDLFGIRDREVTKHGRQMWLEIVGRG